MYPLSSSLALLLLHHLVSSTSVLQALVLVLGALHLSLPFQVLLAVVSIPAQVRLSDQTRCHCIRERLHSSSVASFSDPEMQMRPQVGWDSL